VIVKNGGGKMLEQPLLMSSALRASARSLGFLMGYRPAIVRRWLETLCRGRKRRICAVAYHNNLPPASSCHQECLLVSGCTWFNYTSFTISDMQRALIVTDHLLSTGVHARRRRRNLTSLLERNPSTRSFDVRLAPSNFTAAAAAGEERSIGEEH